MSSIYTNNGELKKTHVHKLIELVMPNQFGDLYRCRDCRAGLKRKSGIVVGREVIDGNHMMVIPTVQS